MKQFIIGWNDYPDARGVMLDAEPVGEHPFDLAVIAVSVAGLCEVNDLREAAGVGPERAHTLETYGIGLR